MPLLRPANRCALVIGAAVLIASASTGTAQSPFGGVFNFFQPPPPPPQPRAYVDPSQDFHVRRAPEEPRASQRDQSVAYCVRLCDGRYFPLPDLRRRSAAKLCSSFCPAASTKVFTGPEIDHSTADDGSDYTDLHTAYLYRDHLVQGCTCNGKDAFGLARIPADSDPTLQTGDMLATKDGLKVFHESSRRAGNFTPVRKYSRLPKRVRDKLATIPVGPQD
ncbi:MAG TPA: DUF2865 domain-containing protein [Xanthobacteraceae bacterium]|jgi:hypothetical protein|nr:DUF2865 domain-containing protein [Xanthobacteraceae bacterium]